MMSSAEMDEFVAELRNLTKSKPPVSAKTINTLTQLAVKHAKVTTPPLPLFHPILAPDDVIR